MALIKKDIDLLKTIFATKVELAAFRNEMLTNFDKVMSKLESLMIDNKVGANRDHEHDMRLTNIEEVIGLKLVL